MRSFLLYSGSIASFLVLAACSTETGGKTSGTGAAAPTDLAPPPESQGFQLAFDAKVTAGAEVHVCKEFVVPGSGDVTVDKFEAEAPVGMHHILAYHVPKNAADVTDDVFDCGDVPGAIWYEQSADAIGSSFPEGVGIKLQGGEVVRVELHDLNITAADASRNVRVNAWFSKKPLTAEAGSFFMYDRDIAIAAHSQFTARMHCEIPADITITDILPHLHVHGIAERFYLSGGDLEAPQLILSTTGYGDQELRKFDKQPLLVKKGQSLDFECDYDNSTDENVVEGPSKEHNEMCMLLGDYYPKMDRAAEWCTVEGSGPVHSGSTTCADAYKALQSGNNTDFAAEQKMVDVCASSNTQWNDLGNCGFNACSDVCPGPNCSACASKSCLNEFVACQSAKCD